MKEELIDKIIRQCKIYSKRNYLGSDGIHHKYSSDESIDIAKLEEILKEFLDNSEREKLINDIELLIANEANLARSDGFPTSRLTSLFNKIKEMKII
jgi:hypothetical protein